MSLEMADAVICRMASPKEGEEASLVFHKRFVIFVY